MACLRKEDFKEGNIVRFRKWEDMAEEYGLDEDGDIEIDWSIHFQIGMQYLCGKKIKLSNIDLGSDFEFFYDGWYLTRHMLEPIKSKKRSETAKKAKRDENGRFKPKDYDLSKEGEELKKRAEEYIGDYLADEGMIKSAVGELQFANICTEKLLNALNDIESFTNDNLAKEVAKNAKSRHHLDKLIHTRTLFK